MIQKKLMESFSSLSHKLEKVINFDEVLLAINTEAVRLLDAERATIYVFDDVKNELWSKVAHDLEIDEIRLKIGEGIAGYVAEAKQLSNIKDVYKDNRFNPKWDELTSYKTRTILAAPLLNVHSELIGVIEVINKIDGCFTDKDERLLTILSRIAAIAIEQAKLNEINYLLREYNQNIISNINSILVVTDLQFDIVYFNKLFLQFFDLPDMKPYEKNLKDVLEYIEIIPKYLEELKSKNTYHLDEVEFIVGNKKRYVNLKGSSLIDKEQTNIGFIIIMNDETEYINFQHEKVRTEKLSLIGNMTNNILHDIKNPLTAIKGYLYLINSKANSTDVSNYCTIITGELDRINNMSKEILDFVRGDYSLNKEICNVKDFFSEIKNIIELEFKEKSVLTDIDIDFNGEAYFDRDKMWRAILNIVNNAKDALGENGLFTMRVAEIDNNVAIYISDNGCGMPDYVLTNIFKPFFTYGKKSGTGLGMSIVKKVIELHNGDITVDSQVNKGTRFNITIPIQSK